MDIVRKYIRKFHEIILLNPHLKIQIVKNSREKQKNKSNFHKKAKPTLPEMFFYVFFMCKSKKYCL